MNSDQENFDQLRRLLKLKRYEQPGPRYFNNFSSEVIARIKADQAKPESNVLDWLTSRLLQLQSFFENKPSVAWGIVGSFATVLVATVIFTEGGQPLPEAGMPLAARTVLGSGPEAGNPVAFTTPASAPVDGSSSNEVGGSLFDQIRPTAMPASWQP